MFKKSLLAFIVLFSILTPGNLFANYFTYSKDNMNIDIPSDWQVNINREDGRVLTLLKNDTTSISIFEIDLNEPMTIEGFYQLRTDQAYATWAKKGARLGTEIETIRAQADFSYVGLYAKGNQFAGEYFFMKGKKGYILSLTTTINDWPQVEQSFKTVLESFWLGSGHKVLKMQPDLLINNDWGMVGQNAHNDNSIDQISEINLNSISKKWEFIPEIREYDFEQAYIPVARKDNLFIGIGDQLACLSLKDGSKKWGYKTKGKILNNLLLYEDILYLIVKGSNVNYLYGLFAKNGNILFKKSLEGAVFSHSIAAKDKLLFIEDSSLKAMVMDTGSPSWATPAVYNYGYYPVIFNNTVLAVKNDNSLTALSLNNGQEIWSKKQTEPLLYPPVAIQNVAVVCSMVKNTPIITGINMANGTELWRYSNPNPITSLLRMPSCLGNNLVLMVESDTEKANNGLILVIDAKSGKTISQYILADTAGYNLGKAIITKTDIYLLRTLVETTVVSVNKGNNEENPIAVEYVDKKRETNTYLVDININTGKSKQTVIFKNARFTSNDIVGFNFYNSGILLTQNNAQQRQPLFRYMR